MRNGETKEEKANKKQEKRERVKEEKIKTEKVSQSDLSSLAQGRGAIRAGSTSDPDRRAQEYAQEGFRGTMFHAKTQNKKEAEDKLLKERDFRYNEQKSSNAAESPGDTYIIKGQKIKTEKSKSKK